MVVLLYNAIVLALDLAAFFFLWQKPGLIRWIVSMVCVAVPAALLALGLGSRATSDLFVVANLAAWAIFLHGPLLCLVSGVVLWRTGRRASIAALLLAAALLATACDAFWIEPESLQVSRVQIESEKIDRPVRIVVLADLQTDRFTDYERGVLRLALDEKPDLILLAGDYLQVPHNELEPLQSEINAFLREIDFSAPLGVFAIHGNVDDWRWARLFDGLRIAVVPSTRKFDLGAVQLTCLGLADSYETQLRIEDGPPDRFHIVIGHCPNFALGRISADLLLAGHTHGGQVRLPLIGAVTTHSQIPKSWAAGVTELSGGRKLVVSRGIGMERGGAPALRFLCRPELVVIDLVPVK